MGKLVGLLSSGIGLALEASATYQSSSSRNVEKRAHSHYKQDMSFGSGEVVLEQNQDQRQTKAFKELQNYAEFQRVLSNEILEDIVRDENHTPVDPQILQQNDAFVDFFSHQPYIHPSQGQMTYPGALPYPVIIPQRRLGDRSRGWGQAYAPALMQCGIDQDQFLNFLNSFNEASRSSPYLDVVNVAALSIGFVPGIATTVVSVAVPMAVRVAKAAHAENKFNSFLNRANAELFAPQGLFAMVMAYKPDQESTTCTVDTSQLGPEDAEPTSTSMTEPQFTNSAPLIYPNVGAHFPNQQNRWRQIGHVIADYGDRRSQARYAYNNPDSTISRGPTATFSNRWGAPNHPANGGGLVSLISGTSEELHHKNGLRKEQKEFNNRRRRKSNSSRSTTARLLTNALEGTFANRGRLGKRSLIGGVRRMINGPDKDDQRLSTGMESDLLYLTIVNNTAERVTTTDSGTEIVYRGGKGMKSPDSLQRQWTAASGVEISHSGLFDQTNGDHDATESRSPPPQYKPEMSNRYYKSHREQDYCIPTL